MKRIHALAQVILFVSGCAASTQRLPNHDLYPVPEFHQRSAIAQAAWLGYGTAIAHISRKINLPPQPPPIILPLEQEADARTVMVSVWKANRAKEIQPLDQYLESLTRVSEAGFMKEYVWVYLQRQSSSSAALNLRLEEFEVWRAEDLQNHEIQTLVFVGTDDLSPR
jgi:hypothetical protein